MKRPVLDDEELQKLLTPAQLLALARLRTVALRLHCRTINDSLAMTCANMLPLFLKERGLDWTRLELQRLLTLLKGARADIRDIRRAAVELMRIL